MALHPAGPFAAALAPGVAPLAWDVGSAVFSLLITLAWLKSVSLATQAGALAPNFSRKLVHSTCGTGFMLLWCIYSDAPSARLLAAVVPALQLVRLWLAGSSTEDASASELVSTLSRTGKRKEALGGPFLCAARAIRSRNSLGAILRTPPTHSSSPRRYTWVLLAATLLGFRSVVAAVAVCQMAVGDGVADIVGRRYAAAAATRRRPRPRPLSARSPPIRRRRFGKVKWPFSDTKSYAGTGAFVVGAWAASLGVVSVYHTFGYTALTAQAAVVPLLAVSVASALVELLPKGQGVMAVLTDDNLTVPACAALVGSLLLR